MQMILFLVSSRRNGWRALASLGLRLALAFSAVTGRAQTDALPALFEPAPASEPGAIELAATKPGRSPFNALRQRNLTVHAELFRALPPGQTLRVRLPLFADTEYLARVTTSAPIGNSFLRWHGQLDGFVNGRFSAVYSSNALFMSVSDGRGREFVIRSTPDGVSEVIERQPGLQGVCAEPAETELTGLAGFDGFVAAAEPPPNPPGNPYSHVDVLVLYTPNARNAAGGTAAIHAKVWQFVNEANRSFGESDTHVVLRLAGLEEIDYDDSSQNLTNHLLRLDNLGDGYMDDVVLRRDAWGADLVCLLPHENGNSPNVLGIANRPGWASVVEWSQDPVVFAHEIGHNLGCRHEADGTIQHPSYASGFRHTEVWDLGLGEARETRVSIMYSGFSPSTKTGYFSNPNINYTYTGGSCDGLGDSACADRVVALGDAYSADNARFLREYRANTATNRMALFYVDNAAPPTGNATERQPETNLPLIYTGYIPAAEIRPDQSPTIRLAPGGHPSTLRITQKSRLEKWGTAGAPARIGL